MFNEFIQGLYLGPIVDYRGGTIVEEGCTTEEFVEVPGTDLKIKVDRHPVGQAAVITMDTPYLGGKRIMRELPDFREGSAYFGGNSQHGRGLAFKHGKSDDASR